MRAPIIPSVDDVTTQTALTAIAGALGDLLAALLADARLVGPVAIGTGDTRIRHGLGRQARGYFLVKSPADVRVFDGAIPEANDPANFVTLRLSSAQTVTLVVF